MSGPDPLPRVLPRRPGVHRPELDPGCAGCALLGLLRALRDAGIGAAGRLGCDPPGPVDAGGARALLAGAGDLAARGAPALLAEAAAAGARWLAIADRRGEDGGAALEAQLAAAGARVRRVDPGSLEEAASAVRWADEAGPPAAIVALARCVRGAPRAPPLAVLPSRCNRCGACLRLGCPALSDPGGDAMAVDAAICTGCSRCAPLCRSGALDREG